MIDRLILAALFLVFTAQPSAADALYMRFCPSDAAIASGTPPACETKPMLLDMRSDACDSLVKDLSNPATPPALVQAMPNFARHFAQYSGWPVSTWCVGLASDFVIPEITGPS